MNRLRYCLIVFALACVLALAACDDTDGAYLVTTPTPQATETPLQHATRLAKKAIGSDFSSVTYTKGVVVVTANIGEVWSNKGARAIIVEDCYDLQKAMFTSLLHPSKVTFNINGALQDKYGNTSTGPYGYCKLGASTAKLFKWDNLSYEGAWDVYSDAWMRPEIQNAS